MKMILIAHRGNTHRPIRERENTVSYIEEALSLGFYVEIDVWMVNQKLYLGHDYPEHETNIDFLISNTKLIIHAKNINAFVYLINKVHCFFHQSDDCTLTSNGITWIYPGKEKDVDNLERCIIVFPYGKRDIPEDCYGICSDEVYYLRIERELRDRYKGILDKNVNLLRYHDHIYDDLLLKKDSRRCIALVCANEINVRGMINLDKYKEYFIQPRLHHTIMVIRGWRDGTFPYEDFTELIEFIHENIHQFRITFNKLIPTPHSLMICGIPDFDINRTRDKIYSMGYGKDALYRCDIVHYTILRWVNKMPSHLQQEFLDEILSVKEQVFATLDVKQINIVEASWTMDDGTYKILHSIPLSTML